MKNMLGMMRRHLATAIGCGVWWTFLAAAPAMADTVPSCTPQTCDWSFSINGTKMGSGSFTETSTGALQVNPVNWAANGSSFNLFSVSGNIDPTLGFSFAAGTTSTPESFAISFSLPISLVGDISANSQLSYSLTSTTSAGATINPTFSQLMTALDASSTASVPSQSFGVNTGSQFSVNGGPATQSSQVFSAANLYNMAAGNGYDLMTVTLAFTLSANSNVAISGFVSQTPVPLPAAAWLFASGLGLFGVYRRKRAA